VPCQFIWIVHCFVCLRPVCCVPCQFIWIFHFFIAVSSNVDLLTYLYQIVIKMQKSRSNISVCIHFWYSNVHLNQ
jgi:hypothetical protein